LAVRGNDPGAFATDSGGQGFFEIARKQRGHGGKL
jgi:hypothetical protein